ncbi:hypothetical protein PAHAL_7G229700 [Panicum hallii]|uniref:LanC-like protein GCL2 n=1 Tax=Panicum hallii TaxID=206008 RepID=A0A2S3I9W3_9POAL|nr:hypothetical protein PAHAL_7G229700 [Panicum hallii]
MADRFFPNDMPGYVEEEAAPAPAAELSSSSSLHTLLSLPYPALAARFLHAALQLKQKATDCMPPLPRLHAATLEKQRRAAGDFTLYTGALGTALLLFRAYSVTGHRADLATCAEIVAACDAASALAGEEFVTFICGRAGHAGDEATVARYLNSFKQLLYGKAGYLWTCSFLNKHLGENTIQPTTTLVDNSPNLNFTGHGWIMHVLLDMDLTENDKEHVKGTLRYMIQNRFPSGNYPCTEGDNYDCLVHWCHGAPGVSLTLAKASQMFPEEQFLEAAADAAEVVWNQGLLKRVGICHGISGNGYTFLSLYRLTKKKEYLYRAKALACIMHGGDEPYSLFEGQAGMAYLFLDMINPLESGFPAYEL